MRHNDRTRIEVPYRMDDSGTIMEEYSDDMYGFLRLEVTPDTITGRYYGVTYYNEPDHQDTRQVVIFEIEWPNYKITQGSTL